MTEKAQNNSQQIEVDKNFEAFKKILPELIRTDRNRFALMRNRSLIACFDTSRDASQAGKTLFDDGVYSVQKITTQPVDLGYFSHAGLLRTV